MGRLRTRSLPLLFENTPARMRTTQNQKNYIFHRWKFEVSKRVQKVKKTLEASRIFAQLWAPPAVFKKKIELNQRGFRDPPKRLAAWKNSWGKTVFKDKPTNQRQSQLIAARLLY